MTGNKRTVAGSSAGWSPWPAPPESASTVLQTPADALVETLSALRQGEGRRLGVLVRHFEDFVVLSPTGQQAEQARELAMMPGEDPDRAVGLEPGQLHVLARVGVQRLLRRPR
ncbi:hypothetical protein [Streptomyces sp. ISID311]|uniref:hypothetical protein n=1 Tax=Streptomyces sp. ISID311 TaxID=2601673 RepID=UPI00164B019D